MKGIEIVQDKNQILLKTFARFNTLRKNLEERPITTVKSENARRKDGGAKLRDLSLLG